MYIKYAMWYLYHVLNNTKLRREGGRGEREEREGEKEGESCSLRYSDFYVNDNYYGVTINAHV